MYRGRVCAGPGAKDDDHVHTQYRLPEVYGNYFIIKSFIIQILKIHQNESKKVHKTPGGHDAGQLTSIFHYFESATNSTKSLIL